MQDTIQQENMMQKKKNTFQITMECASLFMKKSESSPHCVSFKFKHFFFKIFPTKLTGIVLFFVFFSFWLCIFNLKINVHNKKKEQGPYLQQLHIRVSFLYSETLLAVDCEWQGECF